ncbi:MAG TPA: hypothetical protein VH593_30715 [Ktedonobacteraceae bacterium]
MQLLAHEYTPQQPLATLPIDRRIQQQREANVISDAACSLAAIELETGHHAEALHRVEQALVAGEHELERARLLSDMVSVHNAVSLED